MSTGHPGPRHVANRWLDPEDDPDVGLRNEPFKLRCRWFVKLFKECLRHLGVSLSVAFTRPASLYLNLHTGCIGLPWPHVRLKEIDAWLLQRLGRSASRCGTSLQALPRAARQVHWEDVEVVDIQVV